jgi:putative ABC transport system substrate-binding protein
MTTRRAFLAAATGGLLAAPRAGRAQAPGRVWRVAVLTGAIPRRGEAILALEARLAELGYVQGKNLVLDFVTAGGQVDRLPVLATELVDRRPDVIVALSTPSTLALKAATRTIPIVLSAVGDPLGTGIVQSLARPGENITGASLLNVELSGKGLQFLKEAVPAASRVAVIWNSRARLHAQVRPPTEAAGAALKVGLQFVDLRGPDDLPPAFEAITRQRAQGLLVLPDSVSLAHRKPIIEFAASRRLPALYPFNEMTDDGGLMSYGPSLVENARAAAVYVDKVLKGAAPGSLPIAQATKFDLIVNLKTANALGLTLPSSLLLLADRVIR